MNWVVQEAGWAWAGAALLALAIGGMAAAARGWSMRARLAGVVLPLVAAALVALALGGAGIAGKNGPVVILLDMSPSTRQSPWRDPAWVRRLAEARLGPEREVMVVGFARGQNVLLPSAQAGEAQAWPAQWPEPGAGGGASDVAGAWAWRTQAEARGKELAPRWIITDGLLDAEPRDSGAAERLPFPAASTIVPPAALDVGVTAVELRGGEGPDSGTVEVMGQIRAVGPVTKGQAAVPVEVVVLRDGQEMGRQTVTFAAQRGEMDATRWITVRDELSANAGAGAGKVVHQYEVRATEAGGTAGVGGAAAGSGDPWPENDAASALWVPPGEGRILVVRDGPQREKQTGIAGDTAAGGVFGMGAKFVSYEEFPADAGLLAEQGWQMVVLDDPGAAGGDGVPAGGRLPPGAGQAMDSFVRGTGGGLLIVRRGKSFLPTSWEAFAGTWGVLEQLSPVASWQQEERGLHVVMLLDASASMDEAAAAGGGTSKFRLLTQAVAEAAGMLPAADRLTVVAFHDRAEVLADGRRERIASALAGQLAAIAPGGATDIDAALPAVQRALGGDAAGTRRVVVLLTDGEIPAMDIATWQKTLDPADAAGGTELVVIAPHTAPAGDGRVAGVLEQLAGAVAGTRWLATDDPGEWSHLLVRLMGEALAGKVRVTPLAWQMVDGEARGVVQPWSDAWLKPEAVLVAAGTAGEKKVPVAAVAQRGLGKVGAVEAGGTTGAVGNEALLRRMVGLVAAAAGDRRFVLAACAGGDGEWIVTADGADERGFLDQQRLRVQITGGRNDAGATAAVPLVQTGPGHYEARISAAGAWVATVSREAAASAPATAQDDNARIGQLRVPEVAQREWPASVGRPLNAEPLPAVALSADVRDQGRWDPPATTRMSLAALCLSLGALAALAAMWLRR